MYLVNPLSLQIAQQLFVASSRYRAGQNLVGLKDGTNLQFTLPGSEKFTHNLPFFDLTLYYNGMRLTLLDDYLILTDSNYPLSGYGVELLIPAPRAGDHLTADYLIPG